MKHRDLLLTSLGIVACSASALPNRTATVQESSRGAEVAGLQLSSLANPFVGAKLFVNPEYRKKLEGAATNHPSVAASIRKLSDAPTAVWLDSVASTRTLSSTLIEASKQATQGQPVLSVFVVYDLPNRDCSAKASAGEFTVEADGERRYRTEFIDAIAEQFNRFSDQRIAVILEPDSLANLATNLDQPKCAASDGVYRRSIAYAISKLSLPHVAIYLDAAHAGWLGWEDNRAKMAEIFRDVLIAAGGASRIRGFATNVSNYNTLASGEGQKLEPSNPCPDELSYVKALSQSLAQVGIINKTFIIDTARNGRPVRSSWGNWCNIKHAGLGERPQAAPTPLVDAYYWVKPPGESDGVADPTQPRFDASCQSPDSAMDAPQAGQWFEPYFLELVSNASPAL